MQNVDVLTEICYRLDDKSLHSFARNAHLWKQVTDMLKSNYFWWRRTEYLIGRSLQERSDADWVKIYYAVEKVADKLKIDSPSIFYAKYEQGMSDISVLLVLVEISKPYPSKIVTIGDLEKIKNIDVLRYLIANEFVVYDHDLTIGHLQVAIRLGQVDIVEILLSVGKFEGPITVRMLEIAVYDKRTEIVRLLLNSYMYTYDEIIEAAKGALAKLDHDTFSILVERVDLDQATIDLLSDLAIKRGMIVSVRLLTRLGPGQKIDKMRSAVRAARLEELKMLLQQLGEYDKILLLPEAIEGRNIDVLAFLLDVPSFDAYELEEIEDKIDGYVIGGEIAGSTTARSNVAPSFIFYILLGIILLKSPTSSQIVNWMVAMKDRELQEAALSIVQETEEVDPSLIPIRALMLCMLYPTLSLQDLIADLRDDTRSTHSLLVLSAQLVGCYLGKSGIQARE